MEKDPACAAYAIPGDVFAKYRSLKGDPERYKEFVFLKTIDFPQDYYFFQKQVRPHAREVRKSKAEKREE